MAEISTLEGGRGGGGKKEGREEEVLQRFERERNGSDLNKQGEANI